MSRNILTLTTSFLAIIFVLGVSLATGEVRLPDDNLNTKIESPPGSTTEVIDPGHLSTLQRRCTENLPTDFSGTAIDGTLTYPDGGLNEAQARLTITKENIGGQDIQKFTLTSGATNITGWLSAETSCGYTGVTIRFPEPSTNDSYNNGGYNKEPKPQPTIISMTACTKKNGKFILKGITSQFDFSSSEPVMATPKGWGRFCTMKPKY